MKQKTTSKLMYVSVIMSIFFGLVACNGTDSSNKTANDSSATIASATNATDSAARVKATKKKKVLMSVVMPTGDSKKMVKDVNGVYNQAEKAPEFPGGEAALSAYINKNVTYPQDAIDNGTSGTVHVTFVVDEHGKVLNPQALDGKNLGEDIVNQTLKVFSNMPAWTPGTVHNKNVKTSLVVPITFQLEDAG